MALSGGSARYPECEGGVVSQGTAGLAVEVSVSVGTQRRMEAARPWMNLGFHRLIHDGSAYHSSSDFGGFDGNPALEEG